MPLLVQKRSRTNRTAKMRPAASASSRLDDLLRDQSLLLRWVTLVAAVAGLVVALEAWEIPFPYRLDQYAADGITAKIEFGRVNEFDTETARKTRAEQVDPIFDHDPVPLDPVVGRLRADLERVAAAASVDDLARETRAAFGFGPEDQADPKPADMRGDFEALRTAVARPAGAERNPIEGIAAAVEAVVSGLKGTGVLTADELTRNQIPTDRRLIAVRRPGRPDLETVPVPDVLLTELLSETGRVTRELTTAGVPPEAVRPLRRWLLRNVQPTLRFASAATQEARRQAYLAVEEVENRYNPRDILVPPGSRIGVNELAILQAEYAQLERNTTGPQRVARVVTVLMMVSVLIVLNGYYLVRNERVLVRSPARLAVYLAAVVLAVAAGRFLSLDPWRAEVIPLLATVMVVAIAYDQVLATVTAFTIAALVVLTTTQDLADFVVQMSVAAAAIIPLSTVDSRSKLVKVGLLAGVVHLAVMYGLGVLERQSIRDVWVDPELLLQSLKGAGWCLAAGYLVAGSLPFVESLFGVVTDISLLEMTDVSHPLLQELVRRAPGTYNHSMAVATIGETAADAIGANGLLVRVGAYFHDVGKMLKPHYFIENMTEGQRSRHEHLNPAMSTLIIIGHVKDGVDLAREHNLPRRVVDFVEQHHGTTLVEYFFREATRLADQSLDHKSDAVESAFRYPGPKPQTREAAVMMLADAVESASRTLSEPTPKRIESLVHGIALKRLLDGQFDESSLTLSELRAVEESLVKSLIGIYHGRIKYPDQKHD